MARRRTTTASRGPPTRRDWPSCAARSPKARIEKDNTLLAWTDARRRAGARRRVGSGEGRGVPARLRAERIHGAALDEGRRARVRRHQGAGRLAAGERRAAGESRHLSLEGRRAAVRADHPRGPGAARNVRGRRDRRVEKVPQAGRRHDPDRHADGGRSLGDRRAIRRRTITTSPRASRRAATTTRSTPPPARARCIAKRLLAHDGHVARQPLVPVPREPARHGATTWRPARSGVSTPAPRISSTPTTTSRLRSRSGAWPAGRRTASRSCSTTSTTSGRSRSTAARART